MEATPLLEVAVKRLVVRRLRIERDVVDLGTPALGAIALDRRVRGMRTIVVAVDLSATRFEELRQMRVCLAEKLFGQHSLRDAVLARHDHNFVSRTIQQAETAFTFGFLAGRLASDGLGSSQLGIARYPVSRNEIAGLVGPLGGWKSPEASHDPEVLAAAATGRRDRCLCGGGDRYLSTGVCPG